MRCPLGRSIKRAAAEPSRVCCLRFGVTLAPTQGEGFYNGRGLSPWEPFRRGVHSEWGSYLPYLSEYMYVHVRVYLPYLTSSMTHSRGAFLTSSPLICTIWSPGRSLSSLGPPETQKHWRYTPNASKWDPLMWMGVSTLHARNIKGYAFEFALARVQCGLGLRERPLALCTQTQNATKNVTFAFALS